MLSDHIHRFSVCVVPFPFTHSRHQKKRQATVHATVGTRMPASDQRLATCIAVLHEVTTSTSCPPFWILLGD